jgi:hypothetical protein
LANANLIELCCRWLRRSDGLDHAITETGAGLTISPLVLCTMANNSLGSASGGTSLSVRVARLAGPLLRIRRSGSPRQRTCGQEWECTCALSSASCTVGIASEALPVATWLYLGLSPSAPLGPRGCSRSAASASFVHVWAIETHRVRTSSSVAISATTRQYRACTRHSLGAERRSIK